MRCAAALLTLLGCAEGTEFPQDGSYPDSRADGREDPPDAREPPPRPDSTPPADSVTCSGATASVEYVGHCYLYFAGAAPDWATAQSSCAALVPPAHLATIADAGEDVIL